MTSGNSLRPALAIFADFAGAGLGFDNRNAVACLGRAGKAENFDWEGRAGMDAIASLVVDEGAYAAPL